MDKEVADVYGNQVRVRACGILTSGNSLLMVNHDGLTSSDFWCPPGGGVEFGESITQTLVKEFMEETGIKIKVGSFVFGCEYIQHPIHSIEVFYDVERIGGELKVGCDPEIQIIKDVRFIDFDEIKKTEPFKMHGIFKFAETLGDLRKLSGFYRI